MGKIFLSTVMTQGNCLENPDPNINSGNTDPFVQSIHKIS